MLNKSTLDMIQELANERFQLYQLASRHQLTPEQRKRLEEINRELPILWDRYRRELVSGHVPRELLFSRGRQHAA
ncbi:MAG: hypothetical protein Q9O62_02265 [Ardenticatenia bacterium]|nr:hypothetical protein [Ardenticatenia bacterium]